MPGILDSIDWGTRVPGTAVSVYFAAAGEAFDGYTSLGWNAYEIGRVMAALGEFAAVSNLDFSITADAAAATFKLVTVDAAAFGVPGVLGRFNPPGEANAGVGVFSRDGLGWDMNATSGGLEQGGYGYTTLLHEFGHALGLAHPHDTGGASVVMDGVTAPFGSYGAHDLNQGVYTIMSYNSGWRLHPQGMSGWTHYGWSGGLGALDVALIQSKYGAKASHAGDDVYTLSGVNGLGTFYQALYDTGGWDQIRNVSALDSTISLLSATIDYTDTGGGPISFVDGIYGGFTIAHGVVIEEAVGGSGDDLIIGNLAPVNVLDGGLGTDTVSYRHASSSVVVDLADPAAQDTLGGGYDQLLNFENAVGSAYPDYLYGNFADNLLDGGLGADLMSGGEGDDTYKVDTFEDEADENADEGFDVVYTSLAVDWLEANVEGLFYAGPAASGFTGYGNEIDNVLKGGAGDDELDGDAGADQMHGFGGDDVYIVDHVDDEIIEAADAGYDWVETSATVYQLAANVEALNYSHSGTSDFEGTGNALDNLLLGGPGNDTLDGGAGADEMRGEEGDDTYKIDHANDRAVEISGPFGGDTGGVDTVETTLTFYALGSNLENLAYLGGATAGFTGSGNELDNALTGGAGDDNLDGGEGADRMHGLAGDDHYVVDDEQDQVVEEANAGSDYVYSLLTAYTLGANVEKLQFFGNSTDDFIGTGNALDNMIAGWLGDDTLDGAGGADIMIGEAGDDTYRVDHAHDITFEEEGGGADTVETALTFYILDPHIERLVYTGAPSEDLWFIGNAEANALAGGSGDDQLDGLGGADVMQGFAGRDSYFVDDGQDQVIEAAGAGTDAVFTTLAVHMLAANVEILAYVGSPTGDFAGTGNALDNLIESGDGDDQLDGGAGADRMIGYLGDDTYKVDNSLDTVIEAASAGNDTVETTLAAHTLAANVEWLVYSGPSTTDFQGTGNALANLIRGGGGDDTLDGAGGPDYLTGLLGDDNYYVDQIGEWVIEGAGAGTDTVHVAINGYTLGANLENLTYNGAAVDFSGTGNSLANVIRGGSGHDTLDGAGGADDLHGGAGNDTYKVDSSLDEVVEEADSGTDTIRTALAFYELGANLENLVFDGASTVDFTGIGNALVNQLTGGGGEDFLDGAAGADRMTGFAGDDCYVVEDEGDEVVEATSGGADIVYAGLSAFTLAANVENLFFIGDPAADFAGTGNALANDIHGGGGDDSLDGGAGVDRMFGEAGDDTYKVDDEDDLTIEEAGQGTDTVETALTVYALLDNVERLVFTGLATEDVIGIGNGLDNCLRSEGGDDILDGGAGADRMQGGGGRDTYVVDDSLDQVLEAANEGYDEVETTLAAYQLGANVEGLVYTGAPAVAFMGTGNALDNYLEGRAGGDTLDGGAGADEMVGGDGLDTYVVDSAFDLVVERTGGGLGDRLQTALAAYALPDHVEILEGLSEGGQQLTGNGLNNALYGRSGADALDGGPGHDKLVAGAGDDTLDGGIGNDTLDGGAGDDRYSIDSAADKIVETDAAPGNVDIAKTTTSYRLGADARVEMLMTTASNGKSLIDLTGNAFANTINGNAATNLLNGMAGDDLIRGNAGNDTLDGGSGDDILDGGDGNDIFILDSPADIIVETSTAGSAADVAKSSVSYVLAAGVRVETLMTVATAGADPIDLTGNELANIVTGNAAANVLKGMGGGDTLKGAAGDDDLQGGTGSDKIHGGLGNDLLCGGTSVDRFYFNTAPDAATNMDRIVDFDPADDFIHLARSVFTQIGAPGTLVADAFHVIGVGAADAQDRILYDSATGALFYDPDGSGAAAAVQFAALAAGLALAHTDFIAF